MGLDVKVDIVARLGTVAIGCGCVTLTYGNFISGKSDDEIFFAIGIIAILVSIAIFVLVIFTKLNEHNAIDGVIQILIGIVVMIGAMLFAKSIYELWTIINDWKTNGLRVCAWLMGVLNSILYEYVGVRKIIPKKS